MWILSDGIYMSDTTSCLGGPVVVCKLYWINDLSIVADELFNLALPTG